MSPAEIVSLIGVVVVVLTAFVTRRKTNADIASQVTAMALSLIEPLEKRINVLECEKKELRTEMDDLTNENMELKKRIKALETEIGELTKENGELKKRVDDLESENRTLLEERETLQDRVKTLELELSRMRGKK